MSTTDNASTITNILSRYGFTWQGALVGVAIIVVPWCLVAASLISRVQTLRRESAQSQSRETAIANSPTTPPPPPPQEESADPTTPSYTEYEDDINAAPLHLHAIRVTTPRLNSLRKITPNTAVSSRSSSRSRSRSASPAPTGTESSSSSSSYTDVINPDILTDRMGFEELEPVHSHGHLTTTLPPLNERMSDETLEDCHAFSEMVYRRNSDPSLDKSGDGGSCNNSVLETLEEDNEEDEEEEEEEREKLEKQVFFELLDTVSDAEERKELEKARLEK